MGQTLLQWFSEPFNQKLLLGIISAFIIGLIFGRMLRQRKEKRAKLLTRKGDEAFFKGIQYILSNDHDQAIEEFTKAVQVNSDTVETYVALGSLYRSRGDIDRAIRIRQNIILRANLNEQIKLRALFDLGLDYRKGGFLNRALESFSKVLQKKPDDLETLEEVEKINEELNDWGEAFAVRQKIARLTNSGHQNILAHHQTELGKAYQEKGEISKARACFKKAISIHEKCIDAYLHLGDLYFSKQEYKNAMATWKKVANVDPQFTFLEGALRELDSALELDPGFWEARKYVGEILLERDMKEKALTAYGELIPHLNAPYLKFQCANCGFKPAELQWQCPQCKKWDTIDFVDSRNLDTTSPQELPAGEEESLLQSPEEDA
jgi:lipopolysaccharide biosynthesis regulator YciM